MLHTWADGRIENTGALTKKRMETIDDEVTEHALRFIDEAHAAVGCGPRSEAFEEVFVRVRRVELDELDCSGA